MNEADTSEAQRLAEEHWDWIESLREYHRAMEKKLFLDAFIHGYKHRAEKIPEEVA